MLEDPAGLDELRRLGARSVPVLSRGNDYVFAQNIGHVVKFLGLDEATGPVLSPQQLIARLDIFLAAALRMIPQMPDDKLATEVPNRPRSYRVLGHHIFRIAETFLDQYKDLLRLTHVSRELRLKNYLVDELGFKHLKFEQVYQFAHRIGGARIAQDPRP